MFTGTFAPSSLIAVMNSTMPTIACTSESVTIQGKWFGLDGKRMIGQYPDLPLTLDGMSCL